MLFVLITSAKVVHKTKTHYTINNIFSIILINLSATKYGLQLMSDDYILELHRVVIFAPSSFIYTIPIVLLKISACHARLLLEEAH